MLRMTFRAGRMVARSGGTGKPAPKEWPFLGKLIAWALIIGVWWECNWHSLVITAGVLAFVTVPLCLLGVSGQRQARKTRPDPLDVAMGQWRADDLRASKEAPR